MSAEDTKDTTSASTDPVADAPVSKTNRKKKKKKKKKKQQTVDQTQDTSAHLSKHNDKTKDELLEALYGADARRLKREQKKSTTKTHKFWSTQPVPQHGDQPTENGPIEEKTVDEVRATPYPIPRGFEWCSCDMTDQKTVDEVYNLLYNNYVEDDDNMFRFDYSRDFLQWALCPPGFSKDLHVGVRVATSGILVGFITGIPAHVRVNDKSAPMVEINFLCVHKSLRSKRLAPVLIKEVTRRVNRGNVWQAVYTAGVVLPKPVAQNRYYHRSLNPKKLIDIGFSRLQPRMTIQRTIKLYRVPSEPQVPGIRPIEDRDMKQAHALLTTYLNDFKLCQQFSLAEFKHCFSQRDGVINCYVVEDPETKRITDMCSFYTLPSTIIGHERHSQLKAAYSYYNVSTKTPWVDLMGDALVFAKQLEFDVFNALNVMENDTFLKTLKFGIGDGHLQYYIYNWQCPEMTPAQVGLVLL